MNNQYRRNPEEPLLKELGIDAPADVEKNLATMREIHAILEKHRFLLQIIWIADQSRKGEDILPVNRRILLDYLNTFNGKEITRVTRALKRGQPVSLPDDVPLLLARLAQADPETALRLVTLNKPQTHEMEHTNTLLSDVEYAIAELRELQGRNRFRRPDHVVA